MADKELLTFPDVLARLKGACGRTWLLNHLASVPEFDGGPTHRRVGRKIVFLPADFERLLESLPTCRSRSTDAPTRRSSGFGGLSETARLEKARALLTGARRKNSAPSSKRTSTAKG